MSGGSLDYFFCQLGEHAGDFGDKELDELVSDLANLFHDREWFLSGDTGPGDWNESRDAFKKKWFTDAGRKERIEKYLADLTEDVKKSFGISERYCMNCQWWTKKDGSAPYGSCQMKARRLFHRMESCSEWKAIRRGGGQG